MTSARAVSTRAPKTRKHALAGNGLIVDRARRALRHVAEQFGEVRRATQTTVEVATPDGIELTLSYDPGNYVFSRVYNLTVSTVLPEASPVPAGLKLSHRGRDGARYVRADGGAEGPALRSLNDAVGGRLHGIDLHSSTVTMRNGRRTLTVTPLGGSYVWVLIPPVFKATAFPPGEPERILALTRAVRDLATDTDPHRTTTKGPTP